MPACLSVYITYAAYRSVSLCITLCEQYQQLPRQVVSPYKPQDDLRTSLLTRTESDVSDRAPLLASGSCDSAARAAGPGETSS